MRIPLEVTFRNMGHSPAMEAAVREKAQKLDQFCNQIMSCRVAVEAHHKHHHQGNLFHVRIDLTVPDEELVVSRAPQQHHAHEDAYVAIRDAFDAARRQLQDYARRRRGKVKHHDMPPHGRILEIFPEQGYGRIVSSDGREIYFHRNSVLDADFDQLAPGTEVRFDEVPGDEGPKASTVHVIGKHHIPG